MNGSFSNVNVHSARSFNNRDNEFFQRTTAPTRVAVPRKKLIETNIKKNRKLFYILIGLGVLITVGVIATLVVIFVGKNKLIKSEPKFIKKI